VFTLRSWVAWGIAVTIILIAGCAVPVRTVGQNHLKNAAFTEPQRYSGRLSLVIEQEVGSPAAAQSFSGGFDLRGNAQTGELDLLTPLGSIVMQLRWAPGQALLIRGQEREPFPSAQALLNQATGTALTLDQLFSWLGSPGTVAPIHSSDNWQVDLSARDQGRIVARRSQPSSAVLRIVLEQP
jgi:outer membrane lipoprotein LolB